MKIGITQLQVLWNMYKFKRAGVSFGKGLRIRGLIGLVNKGKCFIGDNFIFSSGNMSNAMARNIRGFIKTDQEATLVVGNNVMMSSVVLWCSKRITIEDDVMIGALSIITDTDAHPLDPNLRGQEKDGELAKKKEILIKRKAFIGTSCIICKGVTIGKNSIVGAGSVVTKSIPDNEIWAGNPARFIKKLDSNIDNL